MTARFIGVYCNYNAGNNVDIAAEVWIFCDRKLRCITLHVNIFCSIHILTKPIHQALIND